LTAKPLRTYRSEEFRETLHIDRRMAHSVDITIRPDADSSMAYNRYHRVSNAQCAWLLRAYGYRVVRRTVRG